MRKYNPYPHCKKKRISKTGRCIAIIAVLAAFFLFGCSDTNSDLSSKGFLPKSSIVLPEITITANSFELGSTVPFTSILTITDGTYENPSVSAVNLPESVLLEPDSSELTFSEVGDFDLTFSIDDAHGNCVETTAAIRVADTKAPVFGQVSPLTIDYDKSASLQPENGDVSLNIPVTDASDTTIMIESVEAPSTNTDDCYTLTDYASVHFKQPGLYKVKIVATDAYGNSSDFDYSVKVVDTVSPALKIASDSFSLTQDDSAPDYLAGVSAKDAIDGDITVSCDDSAVNYDTPGTYSITYTATDKSGNHTTEKATVTIKEKPAPPAPVKASTGGGEVYITKTGSKYHNFGCSYLRQSCIPTTLENAKARGLTPCSRCW